MKKNILVMVAALLVGSSAFGIITHFTTVRNMLSRDIRIAGAAGTYWSIRAGGARQFETGVRNDFIVQTGVYDTKLGRVVSMRGDRVFKYNLAAIKSCLNWVEEVHVLGNGTLTLTGVLRAHSEDRRLKLYDGTTYEGNLRSLMNFCTPEDIKEEKCGVFRLKGSIRVTVKGIKYSGKPELIQ